MNLSRCVGKKRFGSYKLAAEVAKLSLRRREGARRESYRCPSCGGWHVGSVLAKSGLLKWRAMQRRQMAMHPPVIYDMHKLDSDLDLLRPGPIVRVRT